MDGIPFIRGLTSKLCTPKDIPKEVRIVQSPYTVTAGWLQPIDVLQAPAESQIPNEDHKDNISCFFGIEAEKPHEVSCPVP
jgi:hypothetical protein